MGQSHSPTGYASATQTSIKYAFDRGRIDIPNLCDPQTTLHIDSKVLEKAEAQEEPVSPDDASGEEDDEDGPKKKLTKDQLAELLRETVDTVGQPGRPGAPIRNVISVGMLSEGWDAKTVTHILGLRASTSQLLCEQVVGRGLRRTSYEQGDDGLFRPEYVNIFGVPFTFLPHEGGEATPPPPEKPKRRVEPDPQRKHLEISWPNVVRIDQVYREKLRLDPKDVPILKLARGDRPAVPRCPPRLHRAADLRPGPASAKGPSGAQHEPYRSAPLSTVSGPRTPSSVGSFSTASIHCAARVTCPRGTPPGRASTRSAPTSTSASTTPPGRRQSPSPWTTTTTWPPGSRTITWDSRWSTVWQGGVHKYRPDFLIQLSQGTKLILEVKGQDSARERTKRSYLAEWVDAVNEHGGFGRWSWDVSFGPSDLPEKLALHNRPAPRSV